MCVLGVVLPYAALFAWMFDDAPISFQRVWDGVVVNRLSLMAWLDVVATAVVLVAFMRHEGRRLQMSSLVGPIAGTCLVGPSFGLPLFLLLRHRAIANTVNVPA